jgi:hypothetical protein
MTPFLLRDSVPGRDTLSDSPANFRGLLWQASATQMHAKID